MVGAAEEQALLWEAGLREKEGRPKLESTPCVYPLPFVCGNTSLIAEAVISPLLGCIAILRPPEAAQASEISPPYTPTVPKRDAQGHRSYEGRPSSQA